MATVNIEVTKDWKIVVPSAATWFTVSSDSPSSVEYASGANNTTMPTIAVGRRLKDGQGMTRAHLQAGALHARISNQSSTKIAIVVVDADVLPS